MADEKAHVGWRTKWMDQADMQDVIRYPNSAQKQSRDWIVYTLLMLSTGLGYLGTQV